MATAAAVFSAVGATGAASAGVISTTTAVSLATAGATIGATIESVESQKEAAAAQERQNRAARRTEAVKAQRQRVQAARQNRIQRSEVLAQATNAGTGTSSGTSGAISSLRSQEASGIGYANAINAGNQAQLSAAADAQSALNDASLYDQIGQAIPTIGQGITAGASLMGAGAGTMPSTPGGRAVNASTVPKL